MISHWTKINEHRYNRPDGAAVIYDWRANTMYVKPWSPLHSGWMAFLPVEEYPLYSLSKKGLHIPKKYMTAENAINAIEKLIPYNHSA